MSDGGGSWPADPTDPECPHCGEPVSAWADYCMHCEADLPAADPGAVDAPTPTATPTGSGGTDAVPAAGTADGDRGLLHPDGLLDDTLTTVVGVVAGVVAGILVTTAAVFALPGGWPFLVGVVAWVGVTVAVVRNRSVAGGASTASYLVALSLLALPVVLGGTAPMAEAGVESQVGFAVVLAVFAWPVAGVLGVVGWLVGRGAVGEKAEG